MEQDDSNSLATSESPEASLADKLSRFGDNNTTSLKKHPLAIISCVRRKKATKRRAAHACLSCRSRKVRCDVETITPCGNCRWANVECVVPVSRQRGYNPAAVGPAVGEFCSITEQLPLPSQATPGANSNANGSKKGKKKANGSSCSSAELREPVSGSAVSRDWGNSLGDEDGLGSSTRPHRRSGYPDQTLLQRAIHSSDNRQREWSGLISPESPLGTAAPGQLLNSFKRDSSDAQLPHFLQPLPRKMGAEDVKYLTVKGALVLPEVPLQNVLLHSYADFFHPYMPLIDLHDFLAIVNRRDGVGGQTSLLLYQAVMFTATAFVDMKHLRDAGYLTRKAARKAFFQKTRLLYDFEYESDGLVLIQTLLLMTNWYETHDHQKDTWHWMGVAISVAYTIGLHRNPETASIAPTKQKLWKRIWWCCLMRDRLIALGLRRPTRIKDGDFDVPMLVESDFEIQALRENNTIIPTEQTTLMRDIGMQKELAIMCIAKTQLCVYINHILQTQYSIHTLNKIHPKKADVIQEVNAIYLELVKWAKSLPQCCQYCSLTIRDVQRGRSTIAVQRTLLHMIYYTVISALHRPQLLTSSPLHSLTTFRSTQDIFRLRVRDAAMQITRMATELYLLRLERFLPTTGLTVILPAMSSQLLEINNPIASHARNDATKGFRQCMLVLEKLCEIHAAADYATGFLHSALRNDDIHITASANQSTTLAMMKRMFAEFSAQTPPPDNAPYMTTSEILFHEGLSSTIMAPPKTTDDTTPELLVTNSLTPTLFDPSGDRPASSVSGGCNKTHLGVGDAIDLELMEGHGKFEWNAVVNTEFDVNHWEHFT